MVISLCPHFFAPPCIQLNWQNKTCAYTSHSNAVIVKAQYYNISQKTPTSHYFGISQSTMNWTNLNNFWYTKSWRYLRLMVILLSTTPEKCHHSTLWNAELFTWSKLYDFPQKLDNFKNSCYVLQKLKLEFQIFSVIAADKSYYCQRWHVFPIFFDTDLSPCCARLQPMSQENWWGWHGFYAYYVFSLHLVHIPDHSVNSQDSHSKKKFY